MPRSGDPDAFPIVMAGVIGILVVVLVILVLQVMYYQAEEHEILKKRYSHPSQELIELRAEQERLLHRYSWADKKKRVVAIPIERAMAVIVKEQNSHLSRGSALTANPAQPEGGP